MVSSYIKKHNKNFYLEIVTSISYRLSVFFLFLLFYLSGLKHCFLPEHQGLKSTTKVPRFLVSPTVIADREYFPTGASVGGVTERATMPLSRTALLSISYFHIALTSLVYLGDALPNWERVPRLSDGAGPEVRKKWGRALVTFQGSISFILLFSSKNST